MRFLTVLFIALLVIAIHMHTAEAVPLRGIHSSAGQQGSNPGPGDTRGESGSSHDLKTTAAADAVDRYGNGKTLSAEHAGAAGSAGIIPGHGGNNPTADSSTATGSGKPSGSGKNDDSWRPSGKETQIY